VSEGIVNPLQIVHIAKEEQYVLGVAAGELQVVHRRCQKTAPIVKTCKFIRDGQRSNFPIQKRLLYGTRRCSPQNVVKASRVRSA
jgi:hypothetical protein